MKDKFRGMWRLHQFETFDSLTQNWNPDPSRKGYTGYILYDGEGHMAVHLQPATYYNSELPEVVDTTDCKELKNMAELFGSNYVYFASYQIEKGRIHHTKLSTTSPADKGAVAIREFEFKADTLILKPTEKIDGKILRLKWIKVK